ncbi:porin [Massilia sp. TS11]|uniref:porin n=1 Tax=Massilia sp. TS11 TaxID=2908003 RepID=UPI001EDB976E|nr:porin [Massilia sp. TS11]MCG2586481.1 porin [Massilia sp. TS11]
MFGTTNRRRALAAAGLCLLTLSAAAGQEAAKTGEPEAAPKAGLDWFASIDAMYYRWADPHAPSERTWNLNGIRESLVGVKFGEADAAASGLQPLLHIEFGLGADRGEHGRQWTLEPRQTYAGVAGAWGQLTVGQQNNVMTNIAWGVLNPIDNGWGIYWNDLLYMGDSFTDGRADAGALAEAGANWFNGYLQRGLVYQFKGEGFSLQADYMNALKRPGTVGGTLGLGGTWQQGKLTFAGAFTRQRTEDGRAHRQNAVLGAVLDLEPVKLYLSHMRANNSLGARYHISYGGVGFQASKQLHLSAAYARYRQNSAAAWGSGHAHGVAAVADYALDERTNVYLEADLRRHSGGADGAMAEYKTPGLERNLMFGLAYTF